MDPFYIALIGIGIMATIFFIIARVEDCKIGKTHKCN